MDRFRPRAGFSSIQASQFGVPNPRKPHGANSVVKSASIHLLRRVGGTAKKGFLPQYLFATYQLISISRYVRSSIPSSSSILPQTSTQFPGKTDKSPQISPLKTAQPLPFTTGAPYGVLGVWVPISASWLGSGFRHSPKLTAIPTNPKRSNGLPPLTLQASIPPKPRSPQRLVFHP